MKKICVIGAGSSGLAAIKACKEENMDVDCFEATEKFGGLWRFHDEDSDERPSLMKSTTINTSKEMSCFSDFPPPKEFANFMHHSYMLEYFRLYAVHFDLLKHIRYKCKVMKVVMAEDYKYSGRWKVSVKDLQRELTFTNLYDGVMVCTGHHTVPHKPKFEGIEDFGGRIMHTHSLKTANGFEDRKVLIIGIGNSAMDASAEISRVSEKVERNYLDLYELVFPANFSHPSLSFIGLIQPIGSIFPIAEAQCRWFAQLMIGKVQLPPSAKRIEEIEKRHKYTAKRFVNSPRHTIEIDYVTYLDEISSEFGAKPNLCTMALKDPKLCYACLIGPCVPYQYRLNGPHAWEGARNAILSVSDRIDAALQTRKV